MTNYTVFALTDNEEKANVVASSLERMTPCPVGVGVMEIEDGKRLWEVASFFSKKPNLLEIKILEVAYKIDFVVSKIISRDWVAEVQRGLRPIRAGRFVLYGNHDRGIVPVNAINLKIEAAMAFGTGHHATTVGCLLALDRLIKKGYLFKNIADIGCGTGVLAMAAARVCQAHVVATDIDPVAIETAKVNVNVNGLNSRIALAHCDGFNKIDVIKRAGFDLIFANILANPLCRLARNMAKYNEFEGLIILSGILHRQTNRVQSYYTANGFTRLFIQSIDQWTTIVMKRN